jgi:hypothetical protein
MAKVKFDVTGVETRGGDLPKPGVYAAKIDEITRRTGEKNDLAVVYRITAPKENAGFPVYDYVPLKGKDEPGAFRLRGFLEAVGIVDDSKEKGTLDTDKLVGTKVLVRTKIQKSEEFGEQVKVAFVMPPKDAEDEDEDLDEDEENGASDDEDDEDVDLDEMDRAALKEYVIEQELELEGASGIGKFKKSWSDDDVRVKIAEAAEAKEKASGGDDEDEEDEETASEPEDDYDDYDLDALRKECKERELSAKGSKKLLIARLRKNDQDDDPFES